MIGVDRRSALSFAVLALFSLSLAATSKAPVDKADGAAADAGLSPDKAYTAIAAASGAPVPATPCTNALLESAAKEATVAESWEKADVHHLVLIDQPVAAGMNAAAPRQNHPDDGWRWINSPIVKDLYPTSWTVTEQSETNNADRIRRLASRPLFAVIRAEVRVLPKVTTSNEYTGGKLIGRLVVSIADGARAAASG